MPKTTPTDRHIWQSRVLGTRTPHGDGATVTSAPRAGNFYPLDPVRGNKDWERPGIASTVSVTGLVHLIDTSSH